MFKVHNKMKNKEILKLVNKLLKQLDKDFGSWKCKEINVNCAKCQAELFRAYVNWYKDILEDE